MAVPRHADKMGIDPNADIASRRLRTNTWLGDLISENTRFGTILGRHGCLILFRWGYEQMFVEVTSPKHVVTFGMLDQKKSLRVQSVSPINGYTGYTG